MNKCLQAEELISHSLKSCETVSVGGLQKKSTTGHHGWTARQEVEETASQTSGSIF